MYLTHLSLTNFRNFTRLDVDVPTGTLLLVGDNAQGKTSLLEAIYFLSILTSFHAESDRQLINFLATRQPLAVARIVASFQRGDDQHQLEVRVIQEPNGGNASTRVRKEVLLDGVKCKASQALGQFNAVLFLPQMLGVVAGPPGERRRYVDMLLAQVWPGYGQAFSEYRRTLSQRNALLKQLSEQRTDQKQLDFWDIKLARSGAVMIYARIQAIQALHGLAAPLHRELTRGTEILRLDYRPSYDPVPQPAQQMTLSLNAPVDRTGFLMAEIENGFMQTLLDRRTTDIARGVTTAGPHRDEMRFLSNLVDLGLYGSRGQVRTAMLSLKLAEMAWMREQTGHQPVLLLDEVLAELDAVRREDLLARVMQSEQILLTTTDLDLFAPEFVQRARVWLIRDGQRFDAPQESSNE